MQRLFDQCWSTVFGSHQVLISASSPSAVIASITRSVSMDAVKAHTDDDTKEMELLLPERKSEV